MLLKEGILKREDYSRESFILFSREGLMGLLRGEKLPQDHSRECIIRQIGPLTCQKQETLNSTRFLLFCNLSLLLQCKFDY